MESLELVIAIAEARDRIARRMDAVLGGHFGISFTDFQLLGHVADAPGGRIRRVDLAELLAISPSGVTRALQPLERIGLVDRVVDPRDARSGLAVLTASGERVLEDARAAAREAADQLFAGIDPDDHSAAMRALAWATSFSGSKGLRR
jgi:DNA-binding MarR family transcriptional regulator